ncbi:MAG: hypothetical protein P1V81_13010 [Planctomycetota bacterium]|nr:hypothetical protein [Planctomycetota bacterium]
MTTSKLGLALALSAAGLLPGDQPIELGLVSWQRNLDVGLELAAAADKPVLLLFQEVPG